MRNMFGILRVSLLGIFILLISTQTFAACEAELEAAATAMGRDMPGDSRPVQTRIQDNLTRFNQEMREGEAAAKRGNLGQKQEFQRMLAFNNSRVNDSDSRTRLSSKYGVCKFEYFLSIFGNESTNSNQNQSQNNNSNQSQSSDSQQAQQLKQRAQESQQLAQQNQQRAEQEVQKGKRRRHEPENEAHHCLTLDKSGLFGGFINKCNFKISYSFCNYNPKKDSWADAHNCVGRAGNGDFVGAGRTSAAHIKNTETVYWFACKDPAWSLDTEYVPGQGLAGRCRTVGGN